MMRIALPVFLGILGVAAKESPEELANKLEYTLVQYIDDTTCTGKRYVCQPVTLGQTRIFYTHERHGNDKVCATLKENETDATFRVDSCLAAGPECPKECGCYEMMPKMVLDQCYGDTLKGHGKMATMLVKGDMPGCIKSSTSHRMDIDMARYCNQWPTTPETAGLYTKMAEARGVAAKLLAERTQQSRLRMRRRQRGPPGATSMSAGDLPEQGFSGEDVDHANMETQTGDWGKEYGPGVGPPQEQSPAKSGVVSKSAIPKFVFVLLGLALPSMLL